MVSGMARRAKLAFPEGDYNPQALASLPEREVRAEYRRLQKIAKKRLEVFSRSEYVKSPQYLMNKDRYKNISDIQSAGELRVRLSDLANFIVAKGGTVTGMRATDRARIESLYESGYGWVNKGNIKEFGDFMQWLKARYPHKPSEVSSVLEDMYDEYKELRRQDLDPEEVQARFDRWMSEQHPDSVYLQQGPAAIPEYLESDLPEEWL